MESKLLGPEDVASFRKEAQEKENEINRYINVYLSALAVVTGWIIGPQSKDAGEFVVGNNGYNLVLWYTIVFVNIIFSTFLTHRGLIIHDIMQFVTVNAHSGAPLLAWESWRRSKHSATRRVRGLYTVAISSIPIIVAIVLMCLLWNFSHRSAEELATWVTSSVRNGSATPPTNLTQLRNALELAQNAWWVLLVLHAVPVAFIWESFAPTQRRWTEILNGRTDIPRFDETTPFSIHNGDKILTAIPSSEDRVEMNGSATTQSMPAVPAIDPDSKRLASKPSQLP